MTGHEQRRGSTDRDRGLALGREDGRDAYRLLCPNGPESFGLRVCVPRSHHSHVGNARRVSSVVVTHFPSWRKPTGFQTSSTDHRHDSLGRVDSTALLCTPSASACQSGRMGFYQICVNNHNTLDVPFSPQGVSFPSADLPGVAGHNSYSVGRIPRLSKYEAASARTSSQARLTRTSLSQTKAQPAMSALNCGCLTKLIPLSTALSRSLKYRRVHDGVSTSRLTY